MAMGKKEHQTLTPLELEIMQVSIPKQHYYVVSKLGRRLVDLGMGTVALAWVAVNGREERQIVQAVIERFPDTRNDNASSPGSFRFLATAAARRTRSRNATRPGWCATTVCSSGFRPRLAPTTTL